MASFIRTPDHLTIVFDDGDILTVYPSNPNYSEVVVALNDKKWDLVRELAEPVHELKKTIEKAGITADRVKIEGGIVYYDDMPMHTHLTERMLQMADEGLDVAPMSLFLQNMMDNPSYRAVNELYDFLEASNLPITEDGHFLAYKRVRQDWMDDYSGTVSNRIGDIPEMPRNMVDEDKSRTCSAGLHFCSREYLPYYGATNGGRVLVVKINPRDVVAIPSDYNNAKGRTCRYEVINEIKLKDTTYGAMPKAELEGTFRNSGKTTEAAKPASAADSIDRMLVQFDLETGDEIARFITPSDAMRMTGIDSSGISKVARGVWNSAGGYGWKYINTITTIPPVDNTQLAEDMAGEGLGDFNIDDYDDEELWK